MNRFHKIKSFSEIPIDNKKTLIICDIDDTVLAVGRSIEYFYQLAELDLPRLSPYLKEKYARSVYDIYRRYVLPTHTDLPGFQKMISQLEENTESSFVFLTARAFHELGVQQTRKDLEHIGISPNYRVYYTSNIISKGDYIMENIDITSYDTVIFIDDRIENIDSVALRFPKIITYQFII